MQQCRDVDRHLLTWIKDIRRACTYKCPNMSPNMTLQPPCKYSGGQVSRYSLNRLSDCLSHVVHLLENDLCRSGAPTQALQIATGNNTRKTGAQVWQSFAARQAHDFQSTHRNEGIENYMSARPAVECLPASEYPALIRTSSDLPE